MTTYTGPLLVHTLILGNARGPGLRHPDSPAFIPYPSTCGAYLMRALASITGRPEWPQIGLYGIANANDVDDLHPIVNAVQPERIIVLGSENRARSCLDRLGPLWPRSRFGAVPHPVWMLRKHGASSYRRYGEMITEPTQFGTDFR